MALTSGSRLGPYEITAPLGAGGMGEVYCARDTRLDRTVAVKVLPEHLSSSSERLERFRREARTISSLSHPRICTLHDVGEEEGVHFLVLEHLEGQTLADRLERGPLPVQEALRIAAEIAEALDAAHGQGVIHRDLKPGNVMLTKGGLKLLDFGLAVPLQVSGGDASQLPTSTTPVTAPGTVIGTLQYMSPEQVEGKPADGRSDIFALGAVLHEMLTGRRAFQGDSQGALIASILKEDPLDISALPPDARGVERCLRRCLAKDPDERWQSARDLMHELAWLAGGGDGAAEAAPGGRKVGRRWLVPATAAVVALLAGLAAGWMLPGGREPATTAPVHAQLALPEGTQLNGWASPVTAISPDGRAVAFVADDPDGTARLYVRRLGSPDVLLVPDSESAEGPFFSPDGRWLGFAVGVSARSGRSPEMLKYSLETGLTQPICPLSDYFGADWGLDGEILFSNSFRGGLWKVPATGGEPRNALPSFQEEGREVTTPVAWPRLLPDGRHALVTKAGDARGRLAVVDLESGELEDLGIQAERGFLARDRLFYTDPEGTLFMAPFDAGRRVPAGAPVALMDGISLTRFAVPVLDISESGALVYSKGFIRGSRIMPSQLVHIDGTGAASVLAFPPQMISRSIAVSPSGDRLATSLLDGTIWIHDLDRGTRSMLPPGDVGFAWSLAWSPDGLQIAFSAAIKDGWALMRQPTSGSRGPEVVISEEIAEIYAGPWMPGGEGIVFGYNDGESTSIRLMRPEAGSEPEILVDGLVLSLSFDLSPDGRWLAYDSPDSGDYEVYVKDLSGASDRLVVSSGGGTHPRWSPGGETLFYHHAGRIMSVSAPASPGGKFGRPRPVVETDIDQWYSVDPAGGFYGFRPVPGEGIRKHLELILNWGGEAGG